MKMFGFVKKNFIGLTILSSFTNVSSLNAISLNTITLSCISISNQQCKVRPEIANVHSNNPIFSPFSIKTSKCSGNCNNINDPCQRICVSNIVMLCF